MPNLRSPVALAAIAVLLSMPIIAAPASAEVFEHSDPVGDVRRFLPGDNEGDVAPSQRQGDVRALRLDMRQKVLTFAVAYRQLAKKAPVASTTLVVATDLRGNYSVIWSSPDPEPVIFDGKRGVNVDCPRFTWSINDKRTRYRGRIPLSCLGDPGELRIRGTMTAVVGVDGQKYRSEDQLIGDGRRTPVGRWTPWLSRD